MSSFSFYYTLLNLNIILSNNDNNTKIFEFVDFITFVKVLISTYQRHHLKIQNNELNTIAFMLRLTMIYYLIYTTQIMTRANVNNLLFLLSSMYLSYLLKVK